jgi:sulfite reductase beta subunit-like hemoprotein
MPDEQLAVTYDRTVREDIERFRSEAESYTAGRLTDDEFRAVRLRRGIYSQRQAGVHMIRTKVPAGVVTSRQMRQLAAIADEFAAGKAHLTTRQNVQYHFVPLPRVADALHKLADVRLTTREACYNTVRNVTCCPVAGITRDEVFDVRPHARRLAFAFLHKELTDSMPRKFKIAFSGCKHDCIGTSINDLGFRAVIRDGQRGYRVTVGGGLGPLPNESKVLAEFLPEDRIVNLTEAVIRIFNLYGNRKNKNKARLKFVLRERGFDWLKEEVDKQYADILANGGIEMPAEVPEGFGAFQQAPAPPAAGELLPVIDPHASDPEFDAWLESNVEEQKQAGYAIVTVRVGQGNFNGEQMRGLADIADRAGDGLLRFSMTQNVLLGYVAVGSLPRVFAALKLIGLADSGAQQIDDVVTCPGAYSCNLALTKSMNLGDALSDYLRNETDPQVRALAVRISGCPNACGQHWTGDFGFYGNARKIEGKEVPYYQMLLGGGPDETGVFRFGYAIQSIPAKSVPSAVQRVIDHYKANRSGAESFRTYVQRYKVEHFRAMLADLAKPAEYSPEMFQDWGDDVSFSLQLGRGECAS